MLETHFDKNITWYISFLYGNFYDDEFSGFLKRHGDVKNLFKMLCSWFRGDPRQIKENY